MFGILFFRFFDCRLVVVMDDDDVDDEFDTLALPAAIVALASTA